MSTQKIELLIELIHTLIGEDGTWKEKHDLILQSASAEEKTSLEEFASWFGTEEE